MVFHFASILASGQVIEQETFDSATFDRGGVEHFRALLSQDEDFGEDQGDAHFEFTRTGPQSALIEISSAQGDLVVHLLRNSDPDSASRELESILTTIEDAGRPLGDASRITARPLALALLPEATPDARALARFPILLAGAYFEAPPV